MEKVRMTGDLICYTWWKCWFLHSWWLLLHWFIKSWTNIK